MFFTISTPARHGNPSSVSEASPAPRPGDDIRSSTGHRERGGYAPSEDPLVNLGDDAYELGDYRDIQVRKDTEELDDRRREKRTRKREWLEAQDEMKFSHSIQFNAVPDWSTHYIAYSNLKKLSVPALGIPLQTGH